MRRAVTYTHQAGADRSNAPLPPQKKILVIFGSLLVDRERNQSVGDKLVVQNTVRAIEQYQQKVITFEEYGQK